MDELAAVGLQAMGGPAHAGLQVVMQAGEEPSVDADIGAVVVGFDRHLNYYKIQYAQRCIRHLGAEFIATNTDPVTPLTPGHEWAGGGSMVGALVGCTQMQPTVAGKPSPVLLDYLVGLGHQRAEMCMVGDRLNTDILFGASNGLKTILTLSGVTRPQHLKDPNIPAMPDFVVASVSELIPPP